MRSKFIILVTGGLGFIGKHFVQQALDEGCFVINVDKVSYAADCKQKREFETLPNYRFIQSDIQTLNYLPECDVIVNFAAESHVDNAISNNHQFGLTNFMGVQNLLDLVRVKQQAERPLFIQISTDEVYGDIVDGLHTEADILKPSNPYSATKAAADLLIQSFGRTHGVRWRIVRPSNNFGFHQYPEKLIPKSAWRMKRGLPALMHGDGSYKRTWLHANDTVDAIFSIIYNGSDGEIYNVGGQDEMSNIDVLRLIASHLKTPPEEAFVAVEDRAGQDLRYGIDSSLIRSLGWKPSREIQSELPKIIDAIEFDRFL